MTNTSEGIAVLAPAATRGRSGRVAALAVAALALGLGACEGDNRFTGEGPSFDPRILEISAPDSVFAGDTVSVRVDAAAARSVEQIIVSARGAAHLDTVVTVEDPRQQIAQVVRIGIPELVQDTLLRISALVIDEVGSKSSERQVSVAAIGPPVVRNVSGPSGVRPGESIALRVSAFGTRPIGRLDIAARGAINRDTTVLITPATRNVTQDVGFSIPANAQDTVITFNVTAQDESGLTSVPVSGLVPFAIDAPSISLVAPPTVEAGKSLKVAVAAHSLRRLTQVGVRISGGATLVQNVPVSPARASIVEYMAVQLPTNLDGSELRVVAFALDQGGNYSETDAQIVTVPSDVPAILSVDPFASSVIAGHFVDATITAQGDRPISEISVRLRGFDANTLREVDGGPETVLEIDPARNFVVENVSVEAPCVVGGGTLLMLVTARDVDGRLSATVSQAITLTANTACAPEPEPDDEEPAPRAPGTIRTDISARR